MRAETKRIWVYLTVQQIEKLDKLVQKGEFVDRSEAIRKAVNLLLDQYKED